jgi:hypothetical protein
VNIFLYGAVSKNLVSPLHPSEKLLVAHIGGHIKEDEKEGSRKCAWKK